ncbi:MFS transporter [Pseudoxanthomonas wuyuanensis]|uniref:MFS transporter, DHA1 family, inner membrane transport protein n=1 Tax=Pseudoxanthomonas wuyuanensis TaxID=1073196 RepID=A0A286D9P4_9GAMM|nr:MFS transporter [Pseudoxanthomonas wuyuanensis]KAF1719520.1 MFS transporter [Pseudoxanthomonas wuyuanensis]SOD55368.1 MFS transporter, DHA1 family, inner membrane transport protein [Pseudoxanthomonas wuyuanensis]
MRLPIIALAVSAFAIGTTEFVVMGLLPQMADDLGVSIPAAGMLVTGYALGVVFGGPLLAMATARLPRKTVLMVLMGLFIAGNLLCALAPDYDTLMFARVIAALAHGSFFGAGAVVAGHVAGPGRAAQAIALMFTGLTVATIMGVPLGTLLGQTLGWRATFWAVVLLGVAALLIIARQVPDLREMQAPRLGQELRVLRQPQVLLALGMTVFGFGGVFAVFTYIVPILTEQAHLGEQAISWVLALFGLGATCGTLLGGRLADWRLMPALIIALAVLSLFFVVFAAMMQHPAAAVIGVFLIGLLGFASSPGLQTRCVQQASAAPLLASTLNQSAFNLGNAGGAWIGASLLSHGAGYPALSLAAAAVTAAGLGLTLASAYLQRRSRRLQVSPAIACSHG